MAYRYYYRIEKITHRPNSEDLISVLKEVKEHDLHLARLLATKYFLEETQVLDGKYSPDSFSSYNTRRGIGLNFQLLLIDTKTRKYISWKAPWRKYNLRYKLSGKRKREFFLISDWTILTWISKYQSYLNFFPKSKDPDSVAQILAGKYWVQRC